MTVAPIGVAITALVVTMTAVLVAPAAAGEPGARTMQEARAALERTEDQRDTAMRRLEALEEEHAATEREIANLDDSRAAFIEELQDARRQSREATVAAYVAGGGRARYAFESDYSSDSLWRQEVLSDHAQDNRDAQRHYRELRQKADEDVVYLADDLDAILARMDQTRGDIARFENRVPAIEAEIDVLRIIARYGGSRPDPGEAAWATLRSCESHGNYQVNTGNGFYGAYQFDLGTWRSMGGTGLPSNAPPLEQDLRARGLYQTRGPQPWPLCGRFL